MTYSDHGPSAVRSAPSAVRKVLLNNQKFVEIYDFDLDSWSQWVKEAKMFRLLLLNS